METITSIKPLLAVLVSLVTVIPIVASGKKPNLRVLPTPARCLQAQPRRGSRPGAFQKDVGPLPGSLPIDRRQCVLGLHVNRHVCAQAAGQGQPAGIL